MFLIDITLRIRRRQFIQPLLVWFAEVDGNFSRQSRIIIQHILIDHPLPVWRSPSLCR